MYVVVVIVIVRLPEVALSLDAVACHCCRAVSAVSAVVVQLLGTTVF